MYRTKYRAFYRELGILMKLKYITEEHERKYGNSPRIIYVPKSIMKEFCSSPGMGFSRLWYKGKDVVTGKGPHYRGAELVLVEEK